MWINTRKISIKENHICSEPLLYERSCHCDLFFPHALQMVELGNTSLQLVRCPSKVKMAPSLRAAWWNHAFKKGINLTKGTKYKNHWSLFWSQSACLICLNTVMHKHQSSHKAMLLVPRPSVGQSPSGVQLVAIPYHLPVLAYGLCLEAGGAWGRRSRCGHGFLLLQWSTANVLVPWDHGKPAVYLHYCWVPSQELLSYSWGSGTLYL